MDDDPVVFSLSLYSSALDLIPGVQSSDGRHAGQGLVASWAPGVSALVLPADVGLELAAGDLSLEAHYYNQGADPVPDRSGLEVCVTTATREHGAALHWLGLEPLGLPGSAQWDGSCTPDYGQGAITILSSAPHMRAQGQHLTTTISRAGGAVEILYDGDFDSTAQARYPTPAVLQQGDTLQTRWQYASAVAFGADVATEACYNFVLAYRAGSLSSGPSFVTAVNACLDP